MLSTKDSEGFLRKFSGLARRLAYLVADTVEAILPTLNTAVAQLEEREVEGETERVQRM